MIQLIGLYPELVRREECACDIIEASYLRIYFRGDDIYLRTLLWRIADVDEIIDLFVEALLVADVIYLYGVFGQDPKT